MQTLVVDMCQTNSADCGDIKDDELDGVSIVGVSDDKEGNGEVEVVGPDGIEEELHWDVRDG